jgi:hypothetical protein
LPNAGVLHLPLESGNVDQVFLFFYGFFDQLSGNAVVAGIKTAGPYLRSKALTEYGPHGDTEFFFRIIGNIFHIIPDNAGSAGGDNKYGRGSYPPVHITDRTAKFLFRSVDRILFGYIRGKNTALLRIIHASVYAVYLVGKGEFVKASGTAHRPVAYHRGIADQNNGTGRVGGRTPHALTEGPVFVPQNSPPGAAYQISGASRVTGYGPKPCFPYLGVSGFQVNFTHIFSVLPSKQA